MYLRFSPLCSASIMASWLRKFAPYKAPEISVATEIVFLFIIAILHNRLPGVAGTLGLSFVAAFQTASFPRVEGWNYSSVMATSNFRYTIEGLFAAFAGSPEARPFRRPYVFGALCIAFGTGAAIGAVMTERDARLQPRHSRDIARDRAVALRAESDDRQEVAVVLHVRT